MSKLCTLAQCCVEVCTCYQSNTMTGRDCTIRLEDILRHFHQTTISYVWQCTKANPWKVYQLPMKYMSLETHCINRTITSIKNSNACTDYLSFSQTHTDTSPTVCIKTLDSIVIVLSCCRTLFGIADWFFAFHASESTTSFSPHSLPFTECVYSRPHLNQPFCLLGSKRKFRKLLTYSHSIWCDEWGLRCTTYLRSPGTTVAHYRSVPRCWNTLPVCSKHHFAKQAHPFPSLCVVLISVEVMNYIYSNYWNEVVCFCTYIS